MKFDCMNPQAFFPADWQDATLLGRSLTPQGPAPVLIRKGRAFDMSRIAPTVSALLEILPCDAAGEALGPADHLDDRLNVNLRHQLFCAQAVAPGMRAAGAGVIINLGSISWHLGLPDLVLYETAKAGLEGMTRALARDLGASGVRVTCINPGNVKTPRQMQWYTPGEEADILAAQCLKTRIKPRDVTALVLFLASDDARLCTGHVYWVDAGWR